MSTDKTAVDHRTRCAGDGRRALPTAALRPCRSRRMSLWVLEWSTRLVSGLHVVCASAWHTHQCAPCVIARRFTIVVGLTLCDDKCGDSQMADPTAAASVPHLVHPDARLRACRTCQARQTLCPEIVPRITVCATGSMVHMSHLSISLMCVLPFGL